MEEEILKIINRNLLTSSKLNDGLKESAKEITALIRSGYTEKDFVIWFNNHYNESGEPGDKIYDYWLNTVKNGK